MILYTARRLLASKILTLLIERTSEDSHLPRRCLTPDLQFDPLHDPFPIRGLIWKVVVPVSSLAMSKSVSERSSSFWMNRSNSKATSANRGPQPLDLSFHCVIYPSCLGFGDVGTVSIQPTANYRLANPRPNECYCVCGNECRPIPE
jgi:hypothetical protein